MEDSLKTANGVFVVVPAFNEATQIGGLLNSLVQLGYTVVVVDDGSADRTWEVLQACPVIRVRHAINLGQGAALQTAMDCALRFGAQFIVHFDADGQHDPADIPRLLEPVRSGSFDLALGSRFIRAADRRQVPFLKRVVLRAAIFVSWVLTGVWLSDAHNGFRALSRRAATEIQLSEPRFAHATEILREIRKKGLRYTEVPTAIRYTRYSKGKGQPLLGAVTILTDLLFRRFFR